MASTTKDHQVMENLHQTLKSQELLPEKHLVDAGYIDTELLVTSAENFQVDLIGPAPSDSHWQARAGKGFALADFHIDWDQEVVRG
jgi:transposase